MGYTNNIKVTLKSGIEGGSNKQEVGWKKLKVNKRRILLGE